MVLRELDWYMQKNETRPTYTTHWNKLKMDKGLINHGTIKALEENIGSKVSDIPCSNIFADISPREREIREKNKRKGLRQFKKFLHS